MNVGDYQSQVNKYERYRKNQVEIDQTQKTPTESIQNFLSPGKPEDLYKNYMSWKNSFQGYRNTASPTATPDEENPTAEQKAEAKEVQAPQPAVAPVNAPTDQDKTLTKDEQKLIRQDNEAVRREANAVRGTTDSAYGSVRAEIDKKHGVSEAYGRVTKKRGWLANFLTPDQWKAEEDSQNLARARAAREAADREFENYVLSHPQEEKPHQFFQGNNEIVGVTPSGKASSVYQFKPKAQAPEWSNPMVDEGTQRLFTIDKNAANPNATKQWLKDTERLEAQGPSLPGAAAPYAEIDRYLTAPSKRSEAMPTATTAEGVFQWNPKSNAYDIRVGSPQHSNAGVASAEVTRRQIAEAERQAAILATTAQEIANDPTAPETKKREAARKAKAAADGVAKLRSSLTGESGAAPASAAGPKRVQGNGFSYQAE